MKRIFLYYILAVLILLMAVFFFTRPAIFTNFDLSEKGSLGDAINGLTAPIIGLMTAGLLFYSFHEQLKANRLLQDQWQFDTFISMFKDMKSTFATCRISFVTDSGKSNAYGLKAIKIFLREPGLIEPSSKYEFLTDLESFLYELNILIERTKQIEQDTFYLKSKIVRFYRYNLGPPFELLTKDLEKSEPKNAFQFIRTSKLVQENMKTIHYIEFSSEGQQGFDNAVGNKDNGANDPI